MIATGGTIASHFDGHRWTEVGGADLVAELGDPVAPQVWADAVTVEEIATGPSSSLSVDDMVGIARAVQASIADGATGVVVTHGTDTIELSAFVTQLLLGTTPERPAVVFTGAMRPHSHPDPDGPGNLRTAIAVAARGAAVGREVLVGLAGSLHTAARVAKHRTDTTDAFHSHPFAPAGSVVDEVAHFAHPARLTPPATAFTTDDVPLVTCYPGITAAEVSARIDGRPGAVVEAFGDLNVPRQLWRPITTATGDGTLVVMAARPHTGTVTGENTARLGAVGAGGLSAQKARLALMAALGSTTDRDAALALIARYAETPEAQP